MRLREELPEFSGDLEWMNGHVTKANLIGGVPILVHFWSISCPLCENIFGTISKWKKVYGDNFQLVGVHMPRSKDDINNKLIRQTADRLDMKNPICLDHKLIVTKKFQNRIVPSFYLFDKKGLLRHVQSGENGLKMLEKRLILLMKEQKK
ncbi:redoxin domain-containing protein [Bacillus sp. FJAT-22090]|uniref:redoxin domain-containing protein n=1 Tax=Bacillus sp. FJAT-22090 TaxID=1581038 RepID=UPI0011A6F1EF|nr:redoxin domain-containing protein [Bacillus sp. FJAT-22090]